MTPWKLKAYKYFGQGNKFQGSFKVLAAPHEQKSMGLPVPLSILPRLLFYLSRLWKTFKIKCLPPSLKSLDLLRLTLGQFSVFILTCQDCLDRPTKTSTYNSKYVILCRLLKLMRDKSWEYCDQVFLPCLEKPQRVENNSRLSLSLGVDMIRLLTLPETWEM
jgi:hypothetical protein